MFTSINSVARYLFILSVLFIGALLLAPQPAAAAYDLPSGGVELGGFAWSGYDIDPGAGTSLAGVGWISMNCSNTNTCVGGSGTGAKVDYAVTVENNGNLSGYAWSSAVGWISFDPAGPYPTGVGVLNNDARVTSGSYTGNLNFGGWARVCSAAANPGACSGGANPNAGGWDGWIALSGTAAGGYGITMTPAGAANSATNYAWGGPVVAGWIDFSASGPGVVYEVAGPTVTIISPTTPQPAGPVTITFDPISGGGLPDSCTVSDGGPATPITLNSPVTSAESVTVTTNVDTIYTIECTNSGGVGSDSVAVDVFTDLVLNPVTVTLGSVNVAGVYDTVNFTASVSGVTAGTPVPYRLELDGETTITGTLNGSGSLVIDEDFSSVPYSATPLSWTLNVDPTSGVNPRGDVDEGGGPAEVNVRTGSLGLPAPNPVISITVPELVPSGTVADVEVTLTSVGGSICEVFGPGLAGTTFTVTAGGSYINTFSTDQLTNSTNIAISCSVVGGADYVESAFIEIIPSLQEV